MFRLGDANRRGRSPGPAGGRYARGHARPGRAARPHGRRGGGPGRPAGATALGTRAARAARGPPGRPPDPSGSRGHPGPRPGKAVPALRARPHARADLLGLPRPADHDPRGRRPGDRPGVRAAVDRRDGLARPRAGRVRGRRPGRARARGRDPPRRASGALRRQSPARGLPDPRAHLLDHRDTVPRARRADRARPGSRLVVDAGVDRDLAALRLDVVGVDRVLDVGAGLVPPGADPRVPGVPRLLEAPAHRDERHQRVLREHEAARAPHAAADRPRGRSGRGRHPRRGHAPGPDLEGDAGPLRLHGVRALPGGVPGVEHRQTALAQAAGDGSARPPARGGSPAARGARRVGPGLRHPADTGRHRRRGRVGVHHVRGVHAGVPRRHRARRHDRGPSAQPGDGRVAVPAGGRRPAPQPREHQQPLGALAGHEGRLGRRSRRPRDRRGRTTRPSTCIGSAAPDRSTTAPRRSRERSSRSSGAPASRSPCSGPESSARETRPAGWATSTCSRPSPSRTSRR